MIMKRFKERMKKISTGNEIVVLKDYKRVNNYIKRVEKELEKAGIPDLLETIIKIDGEELSIKEAFFRNPNFTYSDNYKDEFGKWGVDLRGMYFIYIYSDFK